MKKAKFAGLNFGTADVLMKDEQKKVKGGGFGYGSGDRFICFKLAPNPGYPCYSSEYACNCSCPGNSGCTRVQNCQ
jgi:hypothetical protein